MIEKIKTSYFNPTQTLTLGTRCLALLPDSLQEELNLTNETAELKDGIARLDDSLSRSMRSDYTEKLTHASELCHRSIRFLTLHTQSYMYSQQAEEVEAGKMLYGIIKQHVADINRIGYVREMAKIKALHTELQQDKYKAATKKLKLESQIKHLIDSRNTFEALYLEKNESEKGKKDILSTDESSHIIFQALKKIIDKINAHLLLTPSETLDSLAHSWNSVVHSVSIASK